MGFTPVKHRTERGVTVRTEVGLREVSVVTFPAYADAVITGTRGVGSWLDDLAELDRVDLAALAEVIRS